MGWLQNAFHATGRRAAWALRSPFWGRYKGILIEPGNCFWALFDYIHLNPVRAGIIAAKALQSLYHGKPMEEAPKSSLTLACSGQCFLLPADAEQRSR
jgi:hypothetical protein